MDSWDKSAIAEFLPDDRDVLLFLLVEIKEEIKATEQIVHRLLMVDPLHGEKTPLNMWGFDMECSRPASYYQALLASNGEWLQVRDQKFWEVHDLSLGEPSFEHTAKKRNWFLLLRHVATLDMLAVLQRLTGRKIKKPHAPPELTIPVEFRTRPTSMREAGKLLGRPRGKQAGEWVRKCIDDGTFSAIQMTRQSFIFDIRIFPESAQRFLKPDKSDRK